MELRADVAGEHCRAKRPPMQHRPPEVMRYWITLADCIDLAHGASIDAWEALWGGRMAEENGKADTNAAGWAGVVQQMLTALGSAAKYAVIVAGILIALYFFNEQSNKARQEGEKINEEKLKDTDARLASAQSQLLKTYTQFQEIGTRQVNNLKDVLDPREQIDKQEKSKRDEIQQIEEKLAEDKRQEAQLTEQQARLNAQLEQRQTLLTAKSNELLHQQTLLDQARLDFEKARLDSAQTGSEK